MSGFLHQLLCFNCGVGDFDDYLPSGSPKPLKVGFIIEGMSGFPSGTWTRFRSMVHGLSSAGIEVHVRGTEGIHGSVANLPIESYELRPIRHSASRLLSRRREIDAFARSTGVQVVHLEAPPFVAAKTVPTIASIHDLRHFYPGSRSLWSGEALYQIFFLPFHLRNVAMIYALSEWSSREIQRILRLPSEKIEVIPPIFESRGSPPKKKSPSQSHEKYAIAIGHIEPRKNLEVIVAASAQSTWPPDVQLYIAGTDQGSLEKICEVNCSLGGKAIFLGPVSDEEKWELLRGAVAALLPSKLEGFGIIALEAPSVGCPVIVAQGFGLEALAVHPSASARSDSPEDWAWVVNAVAKDAKLRKEIVISQNLHAEQFRHSANTKRQLDTYRAVIQAHRLARKNRCGL